MVIKRNKNNSNVNYIIYMLSIQLLDVSDGCLLICIIACGRLLTFNLLR